MKLGKVSLKEPTVPYKIALKASAAEMLKQYGEHYTATYGEVLTMNQLVESMLVDYMRDDKDFVKTIASKPAKSAAPAAPVAPAAVSKEKSATV